MRFVILLMSFFYSIDAGAQQRIEGVLYEVLTPNTVDIKTHLNGQEVIVSVAISGINPGVMDCQSNPYEICNWLSRYIGQYKIVAVVERVDSSVPMVSLYREDGKNIAIEMLRQGLVRNDRSTKHTLAYTLAEREGQCSFQHVWKHNAHNEQIRYQCQYR